MKGIKYVVDEKGNQHSVLIELKEHGKLWEDFHDALIVQKRENEPRNSIETVRERLIKQRKLNG